MDVSRSTMVPFERYSFWGVVMGTTFGGKVTIGVGVADGLGDGVGEGFAEGDENNPFIPITKIAVTITTTKAITPTRIIIFLFLALDWGLFLPHSGLT